MWNLPGAASLTISHLKLTLPTCWHTKALICTHASAAMDTTPPWHAAYPAPRNAKPDGLLPSQVLELLKAPADSGQGGKFVLVDLRRTDHEVCLALPVSTPYIRAVSLAGYRGMVSDILHSQGGTIRGSINLPAQSLYPSIPKLYSIFHAASVDTIIWYCGKFPLL